MLYGSSLENNGWHGFSHQLQAGKYPLESSTLCVWVGVTDTVRLLSVQISLEGCTHPGELAQEYPRHL